MSTTTNLMEIIIPYDMTGKSNITITAALRPLDSSAPDR